MIPSRWSSAIAILRRRQAEALAEERALRRTMVVDPDDDSADESAMARGPTVADAEASFAERLAAVWKQLTGDRPS